MNEAIKRAADALRARGLVEPVQYQDDVGDAEQVAAVVLGVTRSSVEGEAGVDGTPAWAYDEDGYCVCCGNGRWKHHMPACELRDALDGARFVTRIPGRLVECDDCPGLHFASDDITLDLEAGQGDWLPAGPS